VDTTGLLRAGASLHSSFRNPLPQKPRGLTQN